MHKILFFLLVILFTWSCGSQWEHVELSNDFDGQVITIITQDDLRYIIPGSHRKIPDSGYLMLDISEIDQIADEICICWNSDNYKWKMTNLDAKIIKNKLNTSEYIYSESPRNPSENKFYYNHCGSEKCSSILIRENSIENENHTHLKYK